MSKEPTENTPRFCPFKKITDSETEHLTALNTKTVTHEIFEACAGERCMAYCEGDADAGIRPYCMLVESCR